ncbi:hypothetical protein [Flavilitoribacter nigricans]|uniref:Uncharacterized protein n=1 Tax=Flavilitoribacter nigricans (strain ATCC 23147 / DSM 23189 / NBRC 102662 / NCIMB 1420 / SS-2) TaxID=1122177 RepID=A0A2D0N289_FLAN2|nr:hypothetical protein [Flavilitoribacter nigricans]PHN02567.1 hypothetical protein CRP01_31830 [Flavilitoribacter nigricans DSM 23189 = NBRC 102662]
MNGNRLFLILNALIVFVSCSKREIASDILSKTIDKINKIETIYYKQDMSRTDPQNTNNTIQRYREMYFKRLISDSIVGVKGHWYMYVNDKENVTFEDIYDGNRLIRKNNRDSVARIYDLVKYPDFKKKPFWGHNTPYGMQYEFKYMLKNLDSYTIDRLDDTIVDEKNCFQIQVSLEDKVTMPNFGARLEDEKGSVSKTLYFIDKETYYPIKMSGESYSTDNPEQKYFIDQRYYDIKFNSIIDEIKQFNTANESIVGFEKIEMKP